MVSSETTSLPILVALATLLIQLVFVHPSSSQALGLEPPSTKWKIIRSEHADIIYQPSAETKAQRVANIVDYLAGRDSSFIGGPAQRVPIILHSQSTLPAGVPNLAPWRSDWSLAAPQDPFMGAIPWVDGLTIHEYRHHQQMTRGKPGWFSGILRTLLGQTGWFVGILTIQPNWFFEGDATYAETVLTNGGRGRMPKFDREYRTLRISGLDYNYEKASRFSRKDFVPNIYREGYYLTLYARNHFGPDIWTRVLEDTYRRKGFFYPFSRSLKSITGFRTKDLYRAAMLELDSIWKSQDNDLELTESTGISQKPKKVFTDYNFPHYTSSGDILFEKSSFREIRTFYLLDHQGNEQKIFEPGNITPDHVNLSLSGDIITWAENRFHPRWDLKDYSVVFKYNLKTGKKTRLTRRSRYYSPAISADGKRIIALELKMNGEQNLVLLDGATGQKIREYENIAGGQYSYPGFSEDQGHVLTGYIDGRGATIQEIELESGSKTNLLPFSYQVSTRPFDTKAYIYFSGTHTGINNIFALRKSDGRMFQVTTSRFGAFIPALSNDGTMLIFSEYTPNGFEIRQTNVDPENWKPYDPDQASSPGYYEKMSQAEGGSIQGKIPQNVFASNDYNPLVDGLFKIHSWTPSVSENEYGLELISNNIMSNTAATAGYRYNTKENTSVLFGKVSYGALFPIIDLGYSFNLRNSKTIFDDNLNSIELDWKENKLFGGLRIPLKLSSGNHSTNLELRGQFDYFFNPRDSINDIILQDRYFTALETGFEFARIKSRARRQLQPRWGQVIITDYSRSLGDQGPAELLRIHSSLYFPGFSRTHSLNLAGSYQQEQLKSSYRFENRFENARGYHERYFNAGVNTDFEDINLFSANYHFPIVFPDFDLGSIAYFQSVSANLFYDHSEMSLGGTPSQMRSAGMDLHIEFTTFRLFQTSLILRSLHRFDLPDPEMKPFLFDVVFEITDLAF